MKILLSSLFSPSLFCSWLWVILQAVILSLPLVAKLCRSWLIKLLSQVADYYLYCMLRLKFFLECHGFIKMQEFDLAWQKGICFIVEKSYKICWLPLISFEVFTQYKYPFRFPTSLGCRRVFRYLETTVIDL